MKKKPFYFSSTKPVKPLKIGTKKVYTEEEWKNKYKHYEGDGVCKRPVFILVEWDDRHETPSECINRLNQEVLDEANKFAKQNKLGRS